MQSHGCSRQQGSLERALVYHAGSLQSTPECASQHSAEASSLLTDRTVPATVPAADAEAWTSAGGESYCENQEFTNLLARRWLEVLSKPGR